MQDCSWNYGNPGQWQKYINRIPTKYFIFLRPIPKQQRLAKRQFNEEPMMRKESIATEVKKSVSAEVEKDHKERSELSEIKTVSCLAYGKFAKKGSEDDYDNMEDYI